PKSTPWSSSANLIAYSPSVSRFKNLAAATIQIRDMIEPMIFGNSHPITCAAINHGTVKDNAAIRTIGRTPFNALIPCPIMQTIKNGDKKVRTNWINATSPAKGSTSNPVIDANVTVGTPTDPNAVGVEFTTRHAITALIGFNPIPANIEAGIATA